MLCKSRLIKCVTGTAVFILLSLPHFGQTPGQAVTLAAVGDVMLGRGVAAKIGKYGFEYPFGKMGKTLVEADVAFANLENPITGECLKSNKRYAFRAEPAAAVILKNAGLDILSLANNHSLDCGRVGLDNTIRLLDEQGIHSSGAGNIDSTNILNIHGIRIGFAAFTAISPVRQGESFTGVANAEPRKISETIESVRAASDVVVVSFHWGAEYALRPNREQVELAALAVEAGADVVIGHHPHVLQGIELVDRGSERRKALIAYSLGNFVFDSPVRLNRLVGESMVLRITLDAKGVTGAEVVPFEIVGYRPEPALGETSGEIIERVVRLSDVFGTKFQNGRVIMESVNTEKGK